MKNYTIIITILFSSILIYTTCNLSDSNRIEKTISRNGVKEKLSLSNSWEYKILSITEDNIANLTIIDSLSDTLRIIDMSISLTKTCPEYFNHNCFQYMGETYSYFDLDSNQIQTRIFKNDTLFKRISYYNNDTSNISYLTKEYLVISPYYKNIIEANTVKERDKAQLLGIWKFDFENETFILDINENKMAIHLQNDSSLLYYSTYSDIKNLPSLRISSNAVFDIQKIYDVNLELISKNGIIWAERVSYNFDF